MKSILVIGGGLVGAASALHLQAGGLEAVLIDPGDKRRGASFGNAGHIGAEQTAPWARWENVWRSPQSSFAIGGPLDFRWRDVGLWSDWSLRFLAACGPARFARGQAALTAILSEALPAWRRIADLAGAPELVIAHGHANVWRSPAAAERALRAMDHAPGHASRRALSSAELDRYRAVMKRPPAAGVIYSGTGQVSEPQAARDAMLAAFARLGGRTVAGAATHVDANARVMLASGEWLQGDAVLIAAGAWSKPLMTGLGVAAPLIGERGYSLQSAEHDWPADLPTTVFEENFVVLSRFTSGLRATSFLEFGDPDAPADARKLRLLRHRVADLGVRFSDMPDAWTGPRPTLPDYVPAIGRLERAPKVLYAFGHAHLGLTMAPITAELVAALATDNAPPVDVKPFGIERFG